MNRLSRIRPLLLAWYAQHARDLPWRTKPGAAPDPYRVWISEVMLQQTRVESVKPYYRLWIERFPTLEQLAEASEEEVLKSWEGLGYYSRARNLRKAVREVVAHHRSAVPSDPALFRSLPGVGRYTAGAVLSIAYGLEEPVVDGNVRRVFARLFDESDPAEAALWQRAETLVRGERPGDLNQAIMELGATVCVPRTPRCQECPLTAWCVSHRAGTAQERPAPRRAREVPKEVHGVAIIRLGGQFLMVRRPPKGRLAGMWEFPGVECHAGEPVHFAAVRAAREWTGMRVSPVRPLGVVPHRFTHRHVFYHAILVDSEAGHTDPSVQTKSIWVDREGIRGLALPRAQHRILELCDAAIQAGGGNQEFAPETAALPHAAASPGGGTTAVGISTRR